MCGSGMKTTRTIVLHLQIHLHFNYIYLINLFPWESMPTFHPENGYVVMHPHIHAQNTCTLIQNINKSIAYQYFMPL